MKALYIEENKNISITEIVKKVSDTYQLKNTNLSYKINPEAVTYFNKESLYGLIKSKPQNKTPLFFLYSNEPSPININLTKEEDFKLSSDMVDASFMVSKFNLVLQESLNRNTKDLKPNQDGVFKSLKIVLLIQWIIVLIMSLPIIIEYLTMGNLKLW